MDADGAELMLLPFAALGAGVFIPVSAAQQVREAVPVHVEQGNALGMIASEAMDEEGNARLSVRPWAGMLHAEFGGMGRILSSKLNGDEKHNRKKGGEDCGEFLHTGSVRQLR
jgi:hypothetical protein